jgi:hypothetical protein
MRRIYNIFLHLYPKDHRALFASEMLAVFEQVAEERRRRGWNALLHFTLTELIGLVRGAAAEWIAKFTFRRMPLTRVPVTVELAEAQKHLDLIVRQMDYAIANHQFPKVRVLSEVERSTREKLRLLQEKHKTRE